MGCIAIIRRTLFPPDLALFRRAFEAALRATGSPVEGRKVEILDGGADAYHFVIWGEDALDCHCYSGALLGGGGVLERITSDQPAYRAVFDDAPALMFVEASPLFNTSDVEFRRVAIAVAGMLDAECLAIADMMGKRIALCEPETAALLRSETPRRAFEGGIDLVEPAASPV